ncbi:hypothetical protein IE4771_PB00069 (plasmid) [Rhizobium etli bv. mimosae str. IE4771]|uniref:Ferritin-like protein n=1 Tax=Rhizobium etli bv. mimosae str. IE4771 TaxID=1432050 RepID=A0A060I7S4_RHIET|nr:hypothetical protein IE4771_PB00069 [Rhizobium sp. IE4771]
MTLVTVASCPAYQELLKKAGSVVANHFVAAYSNRMSIDETPAEMVARHVLEGERHLANQTALIERLRRMGLPTEGAEKFLERFYLLQAQHEEHMHRMSEECELGLRDKQGNLLPRHQP